MLMPNGKLIIKITEWLTREKNEVAPVEAQSGVCVLDDRLLRSPSIAVKEASDYTSEMCSLTRETLLKSMKLLEDGGVTATVRRTLGGDIDASCGQLRRKYTKEKEA